MITPVLGARTLTESILALGVPMGAEWLCLFAAAVLIAGTVGAVVVGLALASRRKESPHGFPVKPALPIPGRFRIRGVDRATKTDTTWYCEAESEANAKVKAELEGIVVTSVERA